MLDVVYALLVAGIVEEEDLEEPLGLAVDFEHALAVGGMPPAGDGDATLDGGVSPLAIARAFGTRTQFHLRGLSIVHNHGHRGWWFAVQVSELVSVDYIATGLDAHLTLFYLRSHHERVDDVAATLSRALEGILDRHGRRRHGPRLTVDFNTAGRVSDFSQEAYAMIEVLVACPLHSTLHRLVAEAMLVLQGRRHTRLLPAFHLSMRRSVGSVMEPAP